MSGKLDMDCMMGLGNLDEAGDVAVLPPPRPAEGSGDFGGSPAAAAALLASPAPAAAGAPLRSPLEAVLTVLWWVTGGVAKSRRRSCRLRPRAVWWD